MSFLKPVKMIIFANWKIYMRSRGEVKDYASILKNELNHFESDFLEIHIMTDFISFDYVNSCLSKTQIKTGVQDLFWEDFGSYAGEVSPLMLKDLGCSSAYIGHSERKAYFGENDESINKKVLACLRNGIKPLMFIGETIEELKSGETEAVLKMQLEKGLSNISLEMLKNTAIIYEPRWAIGQKASASASTISSMHKLTRKLLSEIYGSKHAQRIPVLYGGSVNLDNIREIVAIQEVDGVGAARAALNPYDFIELVRITEEEAIKRNRAGKV
ncbi:MAG: triose-phosphate isomerase [Actinobacteria bacterium]|nr:triose-phosphate isomerase [Actinomycetota bacterium]